MPYDPPEHVTQHWTLRKPAARGRRGMVASQSRDAAEAGLAILDAGGTAADAAVATALALAVVEPWNSGLGGIGFAVVHPAGERRAQVVDFGPRAPAELDPSRFPLTGREKRELFAWPEVEGDRNMHGPLSAVIPSSVAGYAALHERWGRLPLAEVMAPAVALARRGLSQDWFTTLKVANSAAILRRYPESARIYLPDGLPPVAPYQGSPGFFRQGRLADTLERLSHAGLRDLYEGDVAASIAADLREMDGILTAEDLRGCTAELRPASEIAWEGGVLQTAGGLTAAPTMARVLERLGPTPSGLREPDAAWYGRLAAALRDAYGERLSGLGAAEQAKEGTAESCTTHLTVTDAEGSMVSMTTTLLSSMGSRVVLPGSGVLLNNGVMWFDPRPGQPNSMAPGRRPLCNMSPVVLRESDGAAVLAAGASGGRRILAAVVQMLAFVRGFGIDPEAAAHHPRLDVSGTEGATLDRRLPPDVVAAVTRALDGGAIERVEHAVLPVNFACPNLILRDGQERVGITDAMSPWSAAMAQA